MESLDVKLKVLGPQHSDVANTIENIGASIYGMHLFMACM
jgi:hypothetical protein